MMATNSKIEWTEATWNPVAGCTILSPGCTNCYAMRLAARLAVMGQYKYVGTTRKSGGRHTWNGKVKTGAASLDIPRRWKKGRLIFVNSMSDLFHEAVPLDFIKAVFAVMEETSQHTYQVLTKRAERLEQLSGKLPWPKNVWMGVSVESEAYAYRIDHLRRCKARTRFLSLEPLLGPLDELDLRGIHWAIAGGESGPGARPMHKDWVRSIRDQCTNANVPFHFKQWGGTIKKRAGRTLDGRTWDEWPQRRRGGLVRNQNTLSKRDRSLKRLPLLDAQSSVCCGSMRSIARSRAKPRAIGVINKPPNHCAGLPRRSTVTSATISWRSSRR
jgi:protein gp37